MQAKVHKVMKEWKEGTLHSGKGGKVVKSQKQAVAIAYSVKRSAKKADGGDVTQDKKLIKKAFSIHDKQQHEDKKTNLSKLKRGGSCQW